MQLKKSKQRPRNIHHQLAAATCTLLAGASHASSLVASGDNWKVDSALLIYAEKDRVQLAEGVLRLSKEIDDDEFINVRLVTDVLTGSSPNGAVPASSAQTFTNPSGNSTYTEAANSTPLNHTFKDIRNAINLEWDVPLTNTLRGSIGGNFSREYDYQSLGFNASLSQDINQRNTTLSIGMSFNNDTWDPVGGVPVGFTVMPSAPAKKSIDGAKVDKSINELLFGVTQVINRQTLMQLNYSRGQGDGYLTDPYKIITVLANDGSGNLRASNPYVYENRPNKRLYQSLYWKTVHQFNNEHVLNLSYRYFWDDWGVQSHTLDMRYRIDVKGGHYWQPHLRYYQQGPADFYRQTIIDGEEATLAAASADYRLGEFNTQTIGLKYGYEFKNGAEINFRAEMITQTGKDQSSDAVGSLKNQKLFPDNEAFLLQGGLSLDSDMLIKYIMSFFK
jgi:Protein of unknown function (DUF3570)